MCPSSTADNSDDGSVLVLASIVKIEPPCRFFPSRHGKDCMSDTIHFGPVGWEMESSMKIHIPVQLVS